MHVSILRRVSVLGDAGDGTGDVAGSVGAGPTCACPTDARSSCTGTVCPRTVNTPTQPSPGQGETGQAGAAILHAQGGVWVNGYEARDSSAIFPGDLMETKPGSAANLSLDGSTVLMQPESVAKLQTNLLELDHGSVSVGTSKGFKVHVNCITVVPVLNEWTQYEVTNVNGNVQVAAHKNDVNVERETDHKKPCLPMRKHLMEPRFMRVNKKVSIGPSCAEQLHCPQRKPAGLNPKWIALGAAGAGILLCILVCRRRRKTPISSSSP